MVTEKSCNKSEWWVDLTWEKGSRTTWAIFWRTFSKVIPIEKT